MQFDMVPSVMAEALAVSVIAAVLAGLYPAYKMSTVPPSIAMREE